MNGKGLMKTSSFIAIASIALILLLTLPMASYASQQTIQIQNNEQGKGKGHHVPIAKGWIINITTIGTAYNITNSSITYPARVTFNATVDKSSMGRARLGIIGGEGELKIGDKVYTIEKGLGIIALRSEKIIIHLQVKAPNGAKLQVILKGKITGSLPSPFNIGNSVHIEFTKPQSKIASQFFLKLSGTLTRVK